MISSEFRRVIFAVKSSDKFRLPFIKWSPQKWNFGKGVKDFKKEPTRVEEINEESNVVEELNEESAGAGVLDGEVADVEEFKKGIEIFKERVHWGRRGRSLPR